VPEDEEERARIEAQNPNPRRPLVRYVGETWRVGGLLALSRAFGNAYMKGSLQFEGVAAGSDGYGAGFGVIAEPSVQTVELTKDDQWVRAACSKCTCSDVERASFVQWLAEQQCSCHRTSGACSHRAQGA
jgi:Protein phosphatase 2C